MRIPAQIKFPIIGKFAQKVSNHWKNAGKVFQSLEKSRGLLLLMALVISAAAVGCSAEALSAAQEASSTETKRQTECPVMGGAVNTNLFYDYKDKRIYVCCAGCLRALEADPEKYVSQLEKDGVVLDQADAKASDTP